MPTVTQLVLEGGVMASEFKSKFFFCNALTARLQQPFTDKPARRREGPRL